MSTVRATLAISRLVKHEENDSDLRFFGPLSLRR